MNECRLVLTSDIYFVSSTIKSYLDIIHKNWSVSLCQVFKALRFVLVFKIHILGGCIFTAFCDDI